MKEFLAVARSIITRSTRTHPLSSSRAHEAAWVLNRSIAPEVVHQRVVVQFGSTCNLADWAISTNRRCRARGTCVRGNIFMRMVGNLSVDRALGGVSESCRTSRLQPPLSRVHYFARRKVTSTRYMCPWAHFHAYGGGICRSIVP